jgi:phosphoenolpyruvate-protein kinase (PTS system EI component)
LAIVAREHKIPVVVNSSAQKITEITGKVVEINGESGEITVSVDG